MSYDPSRHHRRSIRLKGYDYTQGGAFPSPLSRNIGNVCLVKS